MARHAVERYPGGLEVADYQGGDDGFGRTGDGEVQAEHDRQGDVEAEGEVERVAVRLAEEGGLTAEQERDDGRARVDTDEGGERGSPGRAAGAGAQAREEPIDAVAGEGEDERHGEAVRSVGEQAAVAEEESLDEQGDADADAGRPGSEHYGEERARDGMDGGSSRRGNVEHHDSEAEGRAEGEQRHLPGAERLPDAPGRKAPDGGHGGSRGGAGNGAEYGVRYVHRVVSVARFVLRIIVLCHEAR